MNKTVVVILALCLFSALVCAQVTQKRSLKLMGSGFEITVVAEDTSAASGYIDMAVGEIQRIEAMISSWDPLSETSVVNKNAGIKPVKVSMELFQLVKRSLDISRLTDGAFDISYASMDKIWSFDGSMKTKPGSSEIKAAISNIGYGDILLNEKESTILLKIPGMRIGFGAIGKGYAADKAKTLLRSQGVEAGIINASGDMSVWGKKPDGTPWKVAITNPMNKNKSFALVPIEEGAVVTSGDYEKYVEFDGIRYAHIIDPRTGYPARGLVSVTIFAPKAELADALATSVFVMGVSVGLDFISQIPSVECILIDDKGKVHKSENIQLENL
jgi:thiamine biosynthesis lipoprotein